MKLKASYFNRGFTLTELLVVIAIMGVLGLIFTDTILQSLRGQNKIKVINQVKQNGQMILDNLANEIRSSNRVICVGDADPAARDGILDTITLKRDESYKRFRLYRPTENINGYIARYDFTKDNIPDAYMADLNQICSDTNFGRTLESRMTDGDTVNGVSVNVAGSDHIFNRPTPKPGFTDVVNIRFSAAAGVVVGQSPDQRVEEGGVIFETSVQMRAASNGF